MKFFHGTSIHNWKLILQDGKLHSKWILDDVYDYLKDYGNFQRNTYLSPQKEVARRFALKNSNCGVILSVDFDMEVSEDEYEIIVNGPIYLNEITSVEFVEEI